jgi:hypothetical protein
MPTKNANHNSLIKNNRVRLRIDKAAANRIIIHTINQLNRENPFEKNEPEPRSNIVQRILFFYSLIFNKLRLKKSFTLFPSFSQAKKQHQQHHSILRRKI